MKTEAVTLKNKKQKNINSVILCPQNEPDTERNMSIKGNEVGIGKEKKEKEKKRLVFFAFSFAELVYNTFVHK